MKDKLYSRWRIKLPNFNGLNSIKAILLILLVLIIISVIMFCRSAYPVIKATCETAASSKGNKIINEEVSKVMENYSYSDLINIDKDFNGKITLIKANSIHINKMVSMIIENIQKEFDKIPTITVFFNIGSVSGLSALKKFEPKFNIELESAGNISAIVRTEFNSVGINQTQHKIYLDVNARVGILTPIDTFGKDISAEVLLTEAVIVGEVPETYYNIDGLNNPTDTYNFMQ